MKFHKTIRFKLTLWYSIVLLLLSIVLVIIINFLASQYYSRTQIPPKPIEAHIEQRGGDYIRNRIEGFNQNQREILEEIRNEDLRQFRTISMLSILPITIVSFAAGYIISGQMLAPIQKLNKQMQSINVQNLTQNIVHDDIGDEMSELINNFNKMTERLNQSFELQKQFVENASHELKTPLAVVQTNLEAIDTEKVDFKELQKSMNSSVKSVQFMNKLIEDLLLLSLMDKQIEFEETDLVGLIHGAVDLINKINNEDGQEIVITSKVEKLLIQANPTLLQRAIMNIVENSIKYSHDRIEIDINSVDENVMIKIADKGEGIAKSDIRKVFERFYRVDKSRSRATGGVGLGLSIVKKIVDVHKGEIALESNEGEGTMITIKLPLE